MEHGQPDPLRARFARVLITGAAGQLGTALAEEFPWADARPRERLGLLSFGDLRGVVGDQDLVLHAAAFTHVDLAERDARGVAAVNVLGTRRVVALGAPVVSYSTDYVFDGEKREPYLESDEPGPLCVYGTTKLEGEAPVLESGKGWVIRSSWLFGWTGENFVRTMLRLGAGQPEVRVVDDQRGSPTFVGHLARGTRELLERGLEPGLYHLAAGGDCTWAELAEAIFEEARLPCRVVRVTSEELGRPARRPMYSVLRSERGAPALPHWRDGLRECLDRLGALA